jgi:hypothetical protein
MLSAVTTSILMLMLIGFATRNLVEVSRIAPQRRRCRASLVVASAIVRWDAIGLATDSQEGK